VLKWVELIVKKSIVYSHFSLPEKGLQTTRTSELRARRLTIYDLRVPTTTLNFTIGVSCKS
jgi:hypothetical protein